MVQELGGGYASGKLPKFLGAVGRPGAGCAAAAGVRWDIGEIKVENRNTEDRHVGAGSGEMGIGERRVRGRLNPN